MWSIKVYPILLKATVVVVVVVDVVLNVVAGHILYSFGINKSSSKAPEGYRLESVGKNG